MKTKYWVLLLATILLVCLGLSVPLLFSTEEARFAEIHSQGQLVKTVSLLQNQEFIVSSPGGGYNVVTVKDGKIAVTEANCPDHHCMNRGFCNSGGQIVCLPNRLVIRFVGQQTVDAVVE